MIPCRSLSCANTLGECSAQLAATLSLPDEFWKAEVQQPITKCNDLRFSQPFEEQQHATPTQALAATEALVALYPENAGR